MIEQNIINWVELGDNMQNLEIYRNKKLIFFFNLFRTLQKNKKFSILFLLSIKFFFFLQIIMLNITMVKDTGDYSVNILKYISNLIFVQDIIKDNFTFKIAVIASSILNFICLLCIGLLCYSVKVEKFSIRIHITILNYLNIFLLNYFVGPIINVSLFSTLCDSNGFHKFLEVKCYEDPSHLIYFTLSLINFLTFFIWSVTLSIYYTEIEGINEVKPMARVNTNYELYTNISKIMMFVFSYFLKIREEDNTLKLFFQIYMTIKCSIISIYVYRKVFFYDYRMNAINLYGWVFAFWFSFVTLLKNILEIRETSIFHLAGFILISGILHNLSIIRRNFILMEFNFLETKSLKDIEMLRSYLLELLIERKIENKTLLTGIIKKFEDLTDSNEEMREKALRLSSNRFLLKKFNLPNVLQIFSMIWIIYEYHLDKTDGIKEEICLLYCYFLIKRMKNITFAIYLLSKLKAKTHKQNYLKFILMEDIKDNLLMKISKYNKIESHKNIQLGSVILYNNYNEMFKTKIYESARLQIEYFDTFKESKENSIKTTENFLKIGEDILFLRKEIMRLWEKMLELNKLNEEVFREYLIYLSEILQDENLIRDETKKFNNIKSLHFPEKNSLYNSLFDNNTSVVLIDGHSNFGRLVYITNNFPMLYGYSGKEVLNYTVNDLCPTVVEPFHHEIIINTIRYSNLISVFKNPNDYLMKGKNGNLHEVDIYLKSIPNMVSGLIFIGKITKRDQDKFFLTLDNEFRISQICENFSNPISSSYCLNRNCINSFIGLIIPEFLTKLEYNETDGFYITTDNFDFKGTLFNVPPNRSLNDKFALIMEEIKKNGKLIMDMDLNLDQLNEYEQFLKDISSRAKSKQSIYFKVQTKTFLGKYRYYRIYISNDLINIQESNLMNIQEEDSLKSNGELLANLNDHKRKKFKNMQSLRFNKHDKESLKKIKINLNKEFNSGEENIKLMGENKNGNDNNDLDKNNFFDVQEKLSSNTNSKSVFSRESLYSANFNKLKKGILEKKEIKGIKYMKLLSYLYLFVTIFLIYYKSDSSDKNSFLINKYLKQNLFFNHSKISVACLYLSSINLKMLKHKVYNDSRCFYNCTEFYKDSMERCINDIKREKENSSDFLIEFKQILNTTKEVNINIFNYTKKDRLQVDMENNLNLIISFALKIKSNIYSYLTNSYSYEDVVNQNLIDESLDYIYDKDITGLKDDIKVKNLEGSYFSPMHMIFYIELIFFLVFLIIIMIFIYRLTILEKNYIEKLVKFKNASFDLYLKSLEELKKRLRNDQGEEDEKLNNDLENDENESNSGKIKNKNKFDKKNTFMEKISENPNYHRKNNKNKKEDAKNKKKKEERIEKAKMRRIKKAKDNQLEKEKKMGQYFIKWNFFFILKIAIISSLPLLYYILLDFIDNRSKNELIEFDITTNSLEKVYKRSFMIYLDLKKELINYIEYENLKENALLNLKENNFTIFKGKDYYMQDKKSLVSKYYKMDIPDKIQMPKIGTILMKLLNEDIVNSSEAIKDLNILYNSDSCSIFYDVKTQKELNSKCRKFWSNILQKGIQQSITHMSIIITSLFDDLKALKQNKKTYQEIIQQGSNYNKYEIFMEIFLFKSYHKTVEIFRLINDRNLSYIYNEIKYIMIISICVVFVLFLFQIYLIETHKAIFNSFMNFIGILPSKYLIEDPVFYKEIIKLETYIF